MEKMRGRSRASQENQRSIAAGSHSIQGRPCVPFAPLNTNLQLTSPLIRKDFPKDMEEIRASEYTSAAPSVKDTLQNSCTVLYHNAVFQCEDSRDLDSSSSGSSIGVSNGKDEPAPAASSEGTDNPEVQCVSALKHFPNNIEDSGSASSTKMQVQDLSERLQALHCEEKEIDANIKDQEKAFDKEKEAFQTRINRLNEYLNELKLRKAAIQRDREALSQTEERNAYKESGAELFETEEKIARKESGTELSETEERKESVVKVFEAEERNACKESGAEVSQTEEKNAFKESGAELCKAKSVKSTEKQRCRYVSSRFLDWDSKAGQRTEKRSPGKGEPSKGSRRRAISLGPVDRLTLSENIKNLDKQGENIKKLDGEFRKRLERNERGNRTLETKKDSKSGSRSRIRSLSMSPRAKQSQFNDSDLKSVGRGITSARKSTITPIKGSVGITPGRTGFKQKANVPALDTGRVLPNFEVKAEKPHSPSFGRLRVVPSRYAQSIQSQRRNTSSPKPAASLSSVKNANGKRFLHAHDQERAEANDPRRVIRPESPVATKCIPRIDMSVALSFKSPLSSSVKEVSQTKRMRNNLQLKDWKTPTTTSKCGGVLGESMNQNKDSAKHSMLSSNLLNESRQKLSSPSSFKTLLDTQLHLPMIKTTRCTSNSPRDSGCIKRFRDSIGKKSFFAPDENEVPNIPLNEAVISEPQREDVAEEVKQTLRFD